MPQSPLTLFKLANAKPAYPLSPVPSGRNHSMGSYPHFPSFRLLTDPHTSLRAPPHGVMCPLLSETVSNKLSSAAAVSWSVGLTILG